MSGPISTIGSIPTLSPSRTTFADNLNGALSNVSKPETDFSRFLVDATSNLETTLKTAETTAVLGIQGKATTYEVAAAVTEAEQSLKMAIAIRDKIVSAYLEISRMQI